MQIKKIFCFRCQRTLYIWEILGCAFGTLWHSAAGLIGFCGASVVIAAGLSNYESCNCQDRRFIERYRSGLKALTKMHSIDRTYQTASYIICSLTPCLPFVYSTSPGACLDRGRRSISCMLRQPPRKAQVYPPGAVHTPGIDHDETLLIQYL